MASKKIQAYVVKWVDSCSLRGWQYVGADHSVSTITTIGWLVKSEKDYVTMTTSITDRGSVMDGLTIPRVAIKSMQRLPQFIVEA